MLGCAIRHKPLRFFHISIYSIFWKVFDTILLHFKHGYLQYWIKWHCITFKELEGSEEVHINQKKKVVSERLLLVFKVVLICFNNISRGKYLVLCTFEANSWQRKWLMLGFKVGHICVNVILVDNMVLFSFLVKRHHNSDRELKSLSKHFYKKTSFQHLENFPVNTVKPNNQSEPKLLNKQKMAAFRKTKARINVYGCYNNIFLE